ncbi:SAM-dependent methyltransferase [Bradyrhizobium lupini]|uniref:SAM-dependent methyltransferase n=1 Tax=Rhizobium lupini TaxID=136996 RepID=UPI003671F8A4
MTILSKLLRGQLETAIKLAREIAEDAAQEAIARMGVGEAEAPARLSDDSKALRRRLRAHARSLGDTPATGAMTTSRLQDATSYEIWHRMLFGRFLAERGLLIHPELGAAMSVAELRDLAKEEGAADEWALAERYAAPGLPGVFKPDDPVLALPIAPEFSKRLRTLLNDLPAEVFTADDSLGWTYQFWRASEKDAVNAAGGKIGAAELPAVTQLFTEPYMVKFLLHNTLGAWWAGKVLARDPDLARDAANEDALREACGLPGVTWEFLRFIRDDDGRGPWRPAAGTFPGWPVRAAEITYCDPCCGSGHFLVEAFAILAALRRQEEGLSPPDAAIAVLRDNLHGLELDGRCVQIAAFNVALAAWKLGGAAIALPSPHIAWVGAPPPLNRTEMATLGNGDAALCRALETLHDQFVEAPLLGSMLVVGARDLLDSDLRERGDAALEKLRGAEMERAEGAVAARGLLDATALLLRRYVLLATNVPFLGRGKQAHELASFLARHHGLAKADLAIAMLDRMEAMAANGGTVASVTPQNWLFLGAYKEFRIRLLENATLSFAAVIGEHGFESGAAAGAFTALLILEKRTPDSYSSCAALDISAAATPFEKAEHCKSHQVAVLVQQAQKANPDARISFAPQRSGAPPLSDFAECYQGVVTGDIERFILCFWEVSNQDGRWRAYRTASAGDGLYQGVQHYIRWENGNGSLHAYAAATRDKLHDMHESGNRAWGKIGVAINRMRGLEANFYYGEIFDNNVAVIFPKEDGLVTAVSAVCFDGGFHEFVRSIDRTIKVTNATLLKVPFDERLWGATAEKKFPDGVPEPYTADPTQLAFHGHPAFAQEGTELHVALARLAGYRWPAETRAEVPVSRLAKQRAHLASELPDADAEGLVTLHARGNDRSLVDRMRTQLAVAYGGSLSLAREQELVRAADTKLDKKEARDATLESWLSDRAFRQHCILFHRRPFLWHVWDGMKGGFSAFLNYHCLDRAALDKLTYTLLGDWIRVAKAEGNTARTDRAEQLQQNLAKIIEGEIPYDIFVRWKPLDKQPLGWEPDFDDGVRLNIRPFMSAGILREQPKGISWTKDRGTDVSSSPWYDLGPRYGGKQGDRINEHHTTLAEKRAARGMS